VPASIPCSSLSGGSKLVRGGDGTCRVKRRGAASVAARLTGKPVKPDGEGQTGGLQGGGGWGGGGTPRAAGLKDERPFWQQGSPIGEEEKPSNSAVEVVKMSTTRLSVQT